MPHYRPAALLEPLDPRQHFAAGFTASYFPTATFTGTALSRTDAAIAFNFGKTSPAGARQFSARWTSQINPTLTGRHAVYVTTEGGVRVWINHQLVLNKPKAPGTPTNYKITINLTANQPADIQIEYRHDAGRASIGVTWAQPGGSKLVLEGSGTTSRSVALADQIDHARVFAADQIGNTYRTLDPANGVPIRSDPGKPAWQIQPFTDWTSGTFAGAMWELNKTFDGWNQSVITWMKPTANAEAAGDAFAREWAAWEPYVASTTGDALLVSAQIPVRSAKLKMATWSPTVQAFITPDITSHSGNKKADVGILMDQTMDMAELLWVGNYLHDTTYRDRVLTHMTTVAKTMVRSDGSVVQRAFFNSATGQFIDGENSQGYSDTSTWSRAQAWAMRSFTDVAAATGDATMLAIAQKVTNYFISHTPRDGVPYWDFQSPNIPHTYRDSSAAAIAASALSRLAPLVSGVDRTTYLAAAGKILTSLTSQTYLAEGTALKGVLQHGAANVPANKGVDSSLMFGDYYFLQAMNDYQSSM